MSDSQSCLTETPPPMKRPRTDISESDDKQSTFQSTAMFCPQNMHLVSVLSNDIRSKRIVLHTRFQTDLSREGIVILEKSSFPTDPDQLKKDKVIHQLYSSGHTETDSFSTDLFPTWNAQSLLTNDVYHRLLVTNGFEFVNGVNMTVIYPAEEHHFKRFGSTSRRIFHESPELYREVIVPFLSKKPRDLSWVENILNGTSEIDRVLYTDKDASSGFTLVLDYRWNGKRIQDMHCLALARDPELSCLRDLRDVHLPMLRSIRDNGRTILTKRYATSEEAPGSMREDQIMAYLHYPPTFYRLHVHFVHVDGGDDAGTRAGRAHVLDEVIRNLELDGMYYVSRSLTIYLHLDSPMQQAIEEHLNKPNSVNDVIYTE